MTLPGGLFAPATAPTGTGADHTHSGPVGKDDLAGDSVELFLVQRAVGSPQVASEGVLSGAFTPTGVETVRTSVVIAKSGFRIAESTEFAALPPHDA